MNNRHVNWDLCDLRLQLIQLLLSNVNIVCCDRTSPVRNGNCYATVRRGAHRSGYEKLGAGEEVSGAGDEPSSKTLRFINQSVSSGKDILKTLCWTQRWTGRWTFIHNFLESSPVDFPKNPIRTREIPITNFPWQEFSQPFFHCTVDDLPNIREQGFKVGGCRFACLVHASHHLVQVASDPAQCVIVEPLNIAR